MANAVEMADEELVVAAKTDEGLMERTLRKYEYLCKYYARMYWSAGASADKSDMLNELRIGLWKAVRDFDPSRTNGSFLSFAHLALSRQAISVVKASWRLKHQPIVTAVRLDATIDRDDEDSAALVNRIGDVRGVDPESALLNGEFVESLRRAIHTDARLSELESACFKLYLEGASYDETADRLGTTSKNVDNSLQRARKKLRPAILDAIECWRDDRAV